MFSIFLKPYAMRMLTLILFAVGSNTPPLAAVVMSNAGKKW
jgi:hypothetical protein